MSWTPTDEQALVEKTAEALWRSDGSTAPLASRPRTTRLAYERRARAVLVAVGPHIAASALRDAAEGA